MGIHNDALLYLQTGSRREPGLGFDANPNDEQIYRMPVAIGTDDILSVGTALDRLDSGRRMQVYACCRVHGFQIRGKYRPRHTLKYTVSHLQYSHIKLLLDEHCRSLESDIPRPDNQCPLARGELRAESCDIGRSANIEDIGEALCLWQSSDAGAGAQCELTIGHLTTILQLHRARGWIDRHCFVT